MDLLEEPSGERFAPSTDEELGISIDGENQRITKWVTKFTVRKQTVGDTTKERCKERVLEVVSRMQKDLDQNDRLGRQIHRRFDPLLRSLPAATFADWAVEGLGCFIEVLRKETDRPITYEDFEEYLDSPPDDLELRGIYGLHGRSAQKRDGLNYTGSTWNSVDRDEDHKANLELERRSPSHLDTLHCHKEFAKAGIDPQFSIIAVDLHHDEPHWLELYEAIIIVLLRSFQTCSKNFRRQRKITLGNRPLDMPEIEVGGLNRSLPIAMSHEFRADKHLLCRLCRAYAHSQEHLQRHFTRQHPGLGAFLCPNRCGRSFTTIFRAQSHFPVCTTRPFKRDQCHWISKTQEGLDYHSRIHGDVQLISIFCNNKFDSIRTYLVEVTMRGSARKPKT
ncbi:hypothetical protein BT63DRAFT_13392 [Microthyrium microscopicum]|uniref:C2H2-type domain-containing protein n=1 Tax=Microthyrium microscopicum TaxID=703497 RepID=A0A6A6USZ5_9PEZI|nr:hypothetical protein BT63DRAFT_13392 [Microthyrium microscopicum]